MQSSKDWHRKLELFKSGLKFKTVVFAVSVQMLVLHSKFYRCQIFPCQINQRWKNWCLRNPPNFTDVKFFHVKSTNGEKVGVSEIHQILTIHSPGTWNMFSKKTLSNSIKLVAVHKAPLFTWGCRPRHTTKNHSCFSGLFSDASRWIE